MKNKFSLKNIVGEETVNRLSNKPKTRTKNRPNPSILTEKLHKSKKLTILLSIILPGLGYVYLGLYERFIIAITLTLLFTTGIMLLLSASAGILGIFLWIYFLHDSIQCVNARNNHLATPLLFGFFEVE